MHAVTVTRQAFGRALFPSAMRRCVASMRGHVAHALNAAHQAQLRLLIQWTREDIAKIDNEMSALPHERLDNERTLLMLESRLREVREGGPAGDTRKPQPATDMHAFAKAWAAGRTSYPFAPCTVEQLYRAYRHWLSHQGLRRLPASQQRFNMTLRTAFLDDTASVEIEAHITGLMTEDVRVVRCWLPLDQLPEQLHERRHYIDRCIAAFERQLAH